MSDVNLQALQRAVTDVNRLMADLGGIGDAVKHQQELLEKERAKRRPGGPHPLEDVAVEMSTALADLVAAIEGKTTDLAPLVAAVRELAKAAPPNVQVDVAQAKIDVKVEPTPVTVQVMPAPIQIMPAPERPQESAQWEIRIPGQFGAPDRVMQITKTINRKE